jgi:very-short-patch-repair endonuclease
VPADEVFVLDGMRVQEVFPALIDTLATIPLPDAEHLLAWLISRGRLPANRYAAALAQRRGRPGTTRLRMFKALVDAGAASYLELIIQRILRKAGIHGWKPNQAIRVGGRILTSADVYFHKARLVIQADGRAHHSSATAFEDDRARTNQLEAAGYTVLRLTWKQVTRDPDAVVALVRAALAKAS